MVRKKKATVPVGKRIKSARLEKKYSLDFVANETGFSVEDLKRIEAGKKTPSVGMLLQLSRALQIDSGAFLREQESVMEKRVQEDTKRTDNYAYQTLTPGSENKHLKVFRVTIDAMQPHSGVGYRHEGEEFVYVLSGQIEVTVGENLNLLGPDDSLHFNAAIPHNLRNVGNEKAVLLVTLYVP